MTFQPTPNPLPPTPRPSRLPRFLLIGCGSVMVLSVLAGIALYFLFWGAVDQLARSFTTDRPLAIPQVTMSQEELEALDRRVSDFGSAIENNEATDPLVLSADEINALIQRHGKFKQEGTGVVVRIFGDQIEGEISLPAGQVAPSLEGRFVNGKGVFSIGVEEGRVVAYLQDLRVGDRYLPDQIREPLSRENLLRKAYEEDSELRRALTRIRSVEVREGKVIFTPAEPAGATP